MMYRVVRFISALLATQWFCLGHVAAEGGGLEVHPVTVSLSANTPTAMVAVANRGDGPARFHISAVKWEQKPNGEMVFSPTQDLVFFPAMLTLNPKEERNLRVGVKTKPGAVEQTYRIFIQQLPTMLATDEERAAVGILAKMAIPVFVEPTSPKGGAVVGGLALQGDKASFTVKSTGTKHYRPETVLLKALDGDRVVHAHKLDPWYILAGGRRDYTVTLPAEACAAVKSLEVEVKSDQGTVRATLGNARCTR
jgi:fimbrial chaperone protein